MSRTLCRVMESWGLWPTMEKLFGTNMERWSLWVYTGQCKHIRHILFSHITFDCTYTTISTTTTINNINNTKTIKTTTNIAMFLVISETYNWWWWCMPLIPALRWISVSLNPAWSTRASSRTARALTQRNPVLKNKNKQKSKKKKDHFYQTT